MAHPRTFRFGVQIGNAPDADLAAHARKIEDLGYSTLFMPDHFGDQLAPVPALMAAADATIDLRVGALVFDNDYKHPVVLAKEMATIDVLSGGRVEFGLGAGWMNTDYEQSGIPKDRDGVRIARMAEALEVIKGLWAEGPFSFAGEHYTITDLDGLPKPAAAAAARRSSSAAVDRRCSGSPAVTPTSSASTRRSRPARSAPTPRATPPPTESTRRSRGCATPPATGSTTSSSTPSSSSSTSPTTPSRCAR